MIFTGVTVDGGSGLRAQIAGFGIEIQRAYAMGAACAGKFHAALDAFDAIGFHSLNCIFKTVKSFDRWGTKVMRPVIRKQLLGPWKLHFSTHETML